MVLSRVGAWILLGMACTVGVHCRRREDFVKLPWACVTAESTAPKPP